MRESNVKLLNKNMLYFTEDYEMAILTKVVEKLGWPYVSPGNYKFGFVLQFLSVKLNTCCLVSTNTNPYINKANLRAV